MEGYKRGVWAGARVAATCLGVFLAGGAAFGGIMTDSFDRPDSSYMGPDWTEQFSNFRIEGSQARTEPGDTDLSAALMTVTGFEAADPIVQVTARYGGSSRPTYVALVSRYLDDDNCIFVKIQDNNVDGLYDVAMFYRGNNSLSGLVPAWWEYLTPFTEARIETAVSGDTLVLSIDRNFDGTPETVVTRTGLPTGLGLGVGLGGYNDASMDDFFALPEPATLGLLALGGLGFLLRRRPR